MSLLCCRPRVSEDARDEAIRYDEHLLPLADFARSFASSRVNDRDAWQTRGLTSAEAAAALSAHGANKLTPPAQTSDLALFAKQLKNGFVLLLIAAGVLGLVAYLVDTTVLINLYLTLILFFVVLVTALISWWEERQTSNVMRSFTSMLPPDASVVRDGEPQLVPAAELVVGDVVRLTAGVKVPADMRLVAVRGLRVETASLTGESAPVACTVECSDASATFLEVRNLVYNSSLVTQGEALGVVVRTGDRTAIGVIAKQASSAQQTQTTMQREVSHFVRVISVLAVVMAVVFFIVGVARGQPWLSSFVNGFLTILVANVPQGLPATVTSLLSLSAARLRKRNMHIKRLDSVEALGSVSLICSDKTGTLTKNQLAVVSVWAGVETMHVGGSLSVADMLADEAEPLPALLAMHTIVSMCNGAQETVVDGGERRVVGNPVDMALLLAFGAPAALQLRQQASIVHERPFDSRAKNHVTITAVPSPPPAAAAAVAAAAPEKKKKAKKSKKTKKLPRLAEPQQLFEAHVKGAPEVLLAMSSHYADGAGQAVEIDDAFRARFRRTYEQFASAGCRVIGFCSCTFEAPRSAFAEQDSTDTDATSASGDAMLHRAVPPTGYTFVGLVALQDPPRERVADAVAACQRAGIKVFVVTGDHPLTARSIAEQVGILPGRPRQRSETLSRSSFVLPDGMTPSEVDARPRALFAATKPKDADDLVVIHGSRIDSLTDAQWSAVFAKQGVVFARTTPQHKLQIVEQARARGFVVAVTGDGVNDAPALKAAHVGVAMGLCGTSVAREAADVALMDDDFATIVDGIREGRVLYANLAKTIAFTLSHLWPEVVPVLLTLAFSFPFGLSGLLVLFIDCGTELVPAISLSYEAAENDVMAQRPRNVATDRLVSIPLFIYAYLIVGMVEAIVCVGAWLAVFSANNVPLDALPWSYELQWKIGAPPIVGNDGSAIGDTEQVRIVNVAQSVWFVTLVLSQLLHIWFCKTRTQSVFQHPVLANPVTDVGVLVAVGIMCLIVYVPALQTAFSTDAVPGEFWLFSLISFAVFFVYSEARKALARWQPDSALARVLTW